MLKNETDVSHRLLPLHDVCRLSALVRLIRHWASKQYNHSFFDEIPTSLNLVIVCFRLFFNCFQVLPTFQIFYSYDIIQSISKQINRSLEVCFDYHSYRVRASIQNCYRLSNRGPALSVATSTCRISPAALDANYVGIYRPS